MNAAIGRPLRVLVSAYACGPHWGSEIGVGWNWVSRLARHCRLVVLTEAEFRDQVLEAIKAAPLEHAPEFHFIDIGSEARRRCWNQGDWLFYPLYRGWQKRAFELAQQLNREQPFDVVHQLNMIGYREPGFLWRLGRPFVWGPVGGYAQMPWRFVPYLGASAALRYSIRNAINSLQMRSSQRVRTAMARAGALAAATPADQVAIAKLYGRNAVLLSEQGATPQPLPPPSATSDKPYRGDRPLRILWCGRFIAQKALGLGLRAVQKISRDVDVELHIVGTGPFERPWKALAERLGVNHLCRWHGQVEHARSLEVMANADCMLLTSLQEGNPSVVMEALGLGIPIVCHDSCGFGATLDQTCAVKIPVLSPYRSIEGFAGALVRFATQPELLASCSAGARERAVDHAWENKIQVMLGLYDQVLRDDQQVARTT